MESAIRFPAKGFDARKSSSRLRSSGQFRRTHSILFSPEGARLMFLIMLGLLLIVRALHVYWHLLGSVTRDDATPHSADGDMTGLYMLVRFYKQHGWPALMGTLGNVVLAGLVFLGSLLSAPAV